MKRILLCLISVILLPLSYSCTLLRAQTLHAIILQTQMILTLEFLTNRII